MIPPAVLGGLVSGGSNLLDVGVSAVAQNAANKQSRRYSTYMYDRQRADALSDWNMQNQYNSPSAQMERYKAAGLNPNLIYGQTNTAPPVRSSSNSGYHAEPVVRQGSIASAGQGAVDTYFNSQMKQVNMDLARSATEVNQERQRQIVADTILKGKQGGLVDVTSAARAFKLGLDKSLVGVTTEAASVALDKQKAEKDKIVTDTFYKMHEDIRRELLTKVGITERMTRVALMIAQEGAVRAGTQLTEEQQNKVRAEIVNMGRQGLLIDLEQKLKKSELDYQTTQRLKGWLETVVGGVSKFK